MSIFTTFDNKNIGAPNGRTHRILLGAIFCTNIGRFYLNMVPISLIVDIRTDRKE